MIRQYLPLLTKRWRQGTATWHMSAGAVDISLAEVYAMSDADCLDYLVKTRFGGWVAVGCPHCGTIDRHYWRPDQERWKCACCDRTFSVTSGTLFTHHKMPHKQLISSTLLWVNSAPRQPALELLWTSNEYFFTLPKIDDFSAVHPSEDADEKAHLTVLRRPWIPSNQSRLVMGREVRQHGAHSAVGR